MNLGVSASTIRMSFLSKNFDFLKKVLTKREGRQKDVSKVLPFAISNHTTNNKDTRIVIVQSVLSVIVSSVFHDWLTSPLLFCSLYICDTTRMVWADQYNQCTTNFSCQHLKIAKYNLMLILKYQLT